MMSLTSSRRSGGTGSALARSNRSGLSLARLSRLLLAVLLLLCGALTASAQGTTTVAAPFHPWIALAQLIVNPYVTIGLLVAGCALLFHDLLTPTTWGVTGTLGVICMGLVFAAFITLGDRAWVGEVLLLAGLTGILLEVHKYPGYGSAIIGFILMFAGMFLSLGGNRNPGFALGVSTFLTTVSGLAFLAYLPKSPAWKRLRTQMHHNHIGSPIFSLEPQPDILPEIALNIGQSGRTVTPLRPVGEAEFGGVRVPVVTEGDFLASNVPIVVTEIDGDRVVVDVVKEYVGHQNGKEQVLGVR